MKKLTICLFVFSLVLFSIPIAKAQSGAGKPEMKNYYLVLLKNGPKRDQDSISAKKIQEGHMKNMENMEKNGKLHIAGPVMDKSELRGIFIMDVKDEEEAKRLLKDDPAISSGRLVYEIHPWWSQKGACLK